MDLATLRAKHAALSPVLTERSRRVWAATEAQAIGYGGIAQVARATGIAASTIQRGLRELASGKTLPGTRTRRPAAAASGPPTSMPRCCGTWTRWWSRRRPAIRTRRCAGRA